MERLIYISIVIIFNLYWLTGWGKDNYISIIKFKDVSEYHYSFGLSICVWIFNLLGISAFIKFIASFT